MRKAQLPLDLELTKRDRDVVAGLWRGHFHLVSRPALVSLCRALRLEACPL